MAACHLPMLSCWMGGVSAEPARELLSAQKIPSDPTPKAAVSAYMTLVKHQRTQELLMKSVLDVRVGAANRISRPDWRCATRRGDPLQGARPRAARNSRTRAASPGLSRSA
jgi:acyl-CoA synthetase (NDP forming)